MMRNGQMARIFKIREIFGGSKKEKHEAHAVRNKKKEPHEEAKQAVTIK